MIQTVVFDTKLYDREPLQRASAGLGIEWRFMDCRLNTETAAAAHGAKAICIFVNDRADRPCLEALAKLGRLLGGSHRNVLSLATTAPNFGAALAPAEKSKPNQVLERLKPLREAISIWGRWLASESGLRGWSSLH
jgi:hypothetical protein